jgi:hypothetical protein
MALGRVNGEVAFPSAARTTTTQSRAMGIPGYVAQVVMMVHVTAVSGTPTLACTLEQSPDGSSWTAVSGSGHPNLTAAGSAMASARIAGDYFRVVATIGGGTPNVTFSVSILAFPPE